MAAQLSKCNDRLDAVMNEKENMQNENETLTKRLSVENAATEPFTLPPLEPILETLHVLDTRVILNVSF